jgi:hypothetical protein
MCLYSAYVQEDSTATIWISEALPCFYSWDVAWKIGHMHDYKVEDDRWDVSDPFSSLVMWGTHNELPEG